MPETEEISLSYPIGKNKAGYIPNDQELKSAIEDIRNLPAKLRNAVGGLSKDQLDTPYRDGGWTVRQVVHHLADSHANALVRVKLALTEDNPTVKPYSEKDWAELPDSKVADIEPSLKMIEGMHTRWASLLDTLDDKTFNRTYFHPESKRSVPLKEVTGMYGWHSRHHLAHIKGLIERKGW